MVNNATLREHAIHLGISPDVIQAAAGSGIDLQTLLQWVMMYGLPIVMYLAKILGWNIPPIPLPPVPPLPQPVLKRG
jgi:hypothetical protein